MWDSLFDVLSALVWDPVTRRPRFALLLWVVAVVVTFAILVVYLIGG